ncbi:unnamed protein product [Dicrocoelium dendriticum]|nr:unnamed protein product [Dicrocoelium dendriticum]
MCLQERNRGNETVNFVYLTHVINKVTLDNYDAVCLLRRECDKRFPSSGSGTNDQTNPISILTADGRLSHRPINSMYITRIETFNNLLSTATITELTWCYTTPAEVTSTGHTNCGETTSTDARQFRMGSE